jgi:hypothetical protein
VNGPHEKYKWCASVSPIFSSLSLPFRFLPHRISLENGENKREMEKNVLFFLSVCKIMENEEEGERRKFRITK